MTFQLWDIEASHRVSGIPDFLGSSDLTELRGKIQAIADEVTRPDQPPFGEITFRYELDQKDEVVVVHAYFTNRHGKKTRFMRLRKDQNDVLAA